MPRRVPDAVWISRREAAEILGVHPTAFARILDSGEIRIQQYPKLTPRYSAEDVRRLVINAVTNLPKGDNRRVA